MPPECSDSIQQILITSNVETSIGVFYVCLHSKLCKFLLNV